MLQSSPTIIITFSRSLIFFIVTRCLEVYVSIASILTFVIVAALMQHSTNVQRQLQNMLYMSILIACTTHIIYLLDADYAVLSCSYVQAQCNGISSNIRLAMVSSTSYVCGASNSTWFDMFIESTFMRYGHIQGGLI